MCVICVIQARQIVFGIREVTRCLRSKSLLAVIISPNANARGQQKRIITCIYLRTNHSV